MRFRIGLLVGGAVGYVLGAKAGQERYEQIRTGWGKLRRSGPAKQLEQQVTHMAQAAKDEVVHLAEEQVQAVKEKVTHKVEELFDREQAGPARESKPDAQTMSTLAGRTPGGAPDNGGPKD